MKITKTLLSEVKKEVKNLKKHANHYELKRLYDNINFINPKDTTKCIYGYMTGDCYSKRATQLLNLCTKPYSKYIYRSRGIPKIDVFSDIRFAYSPIEYYIVIASKEDVKILVEEICSEIIDK